MKPASAHSTASNGCGLSCGSLFYQVKLFAGRRVGPGSPASAPLERQDKNKSHKQSEKKEKKSGVSMGTRLFWGGISNVFDQVCHMKAQE